MKTIKYFFLLMFLATQTIFISCKEEQHADADMHAEAEGEHDEHEDGSIHLTAAQIETIGLSFGSFSNMKVNDFVKATGSLGLPPNGYASVTTKTEGIIKGSKMFVEGNFVKKGAIIAYVENPKLIDQQQAYLETKANLKLKKLELNRQQQLIDANAGIAKTLENAMAEVEILEAQLMGLGKQLSYVGISINNLSPDNIKHQVPIYAPMSGFITNVDLHNGMYVVPAKPLMELVSDHHLHLELDVFEKDIVKVAVGQKITYIIPAMGDKLYDGEVTIIGKEFDMNNKTVRIHGHLEGDKPRFIKDLFINAQIWLNDNAETALPESAIIRDGATMLIYAAKPDQKDETEFREIPVVVGATYNGFTAVKLLEELPEGMQIVTKGAYYVYAQGKAGELEHEH